MLHNQFVTNHAAKDGQDSGDSQAQKDVLRIGVILGLDLNLLLADTSGKERISENQISDIPCAARTNAVITHEIDTRLMSW